MSGLAQILHARGYDVRGSDVNHTPLLSFLSQKGIPVIATQTSQNIQDVTCFVASSAISPNNPEVVAAKALGISILNRAQLLKRVMVGHKSVCIGGTHGKTTTTALIGTLLDTAHLDPTILNGGIMGR